MIEGTRERLLEAVRLRLRADVPVGIYLSGGIDSSVLAGMATHLVKKRGLQMGSQDAKKKICCFSIAFDEESGFDESGEFKSLSKHRPACEEVNDPLTTSWASYREPHSRVARR